jgi:hypothetical protein
MRQPVSSASYASLALIALIALSSAAAGHAAIMYATDDNTDEIYTIDLATGQGTLVGSGMEDLSLSGLAYDTSTGTMYVSDVHDLTCNPTAGILDQANAGAEAPEGSCFGLGTVDLATGAVTFIGSHAISSNIQGLAYDSTNDVLYGADPTSESLDVIDRSTGAATIVGPWGVVGLSLRALAYDAASTTIFGVSSTDLYRLNTATGAATLVGALGIGAPETEARGLEIDPDTGVLYLGVVGDSSFYSVDKATGAATLIGVSNVEIFGLAALPTGVSPTAIPTLSPVGIGALVLLLGALAAWQLARRRNA